MNVIILSNDDFLLRSFVDELLFIEFEVNYNLIYCCTLMIIHAVDVAIQIK